VMTRQRIQRVSREFHDQVRVRGIETDDRKSLARLGESQKIFVNGNQTFITPPTEKDIRRTLETEEKNLVKRLLPAV
jgi:hypothetical protein